MSKKQLAASIVRFALILFLGGWPILSRGQSSAEHVAPTTVDDAWNGIRQRIIPLDFFIVDSSPKVNIELLLVEYLDENVYVTNPLQVDSAQRAELQRIFQSRQRMVESQGHALVEIVEKITERKAEGPVGELEKYAPGLDAYREHLLTARALMQVLLPSQREMLKELAVAKICSYHVGLCGLVQTWARHFPEMLKASNPGDWERLLFAAAEEDLRLRIDAYILRAQAFDRAIAQLTRADRERLERYMKVDAFSK